MRKNNRRMTIRTSSQSSTVISQQPDERWTNWWDLIRSMTRDNKFITKKSGSNWVQTTIYGRSVAIAYYEPIWDSCCGGHATGAEWRCYGGGSLGSQITGQGQSLVVTRNTIIKTTDRPSDAASSEDEQIADTDIDRWGANFFRSTYKHRPNSSPTWQTYTWRIKVSHNLTLVKSSRTRTVQHGTTPTYHRECSL